MIHVAAVILYELIGIPLGIYLVYICKRHESICRKGWRECWCNQDFNLESKNIDVALACSYLSFLIWPLNLTMLLVIVPFFRYLVIPFTKKILKPILMIGIVTPIGWIADLYKIAAERGSVEGMDIRKRREALAIPPSPADQKADRVCARTDALLNRIENRENDTDGGADGF